MWWKPPDIIMLSEWINRETPSSPSKRHGQTTTHFLPSAIIEIKPCSVRSTVGGCVGACDPLKKLKPFLRFFLSFFFFCPGIAYDILPTKNLLQKSKIVLSSDSVSFSVAQGKPWYIFIKPYDFMLDWIILSGCTHSRFEFKLLFWHPFFFRQPRVN